MTPINWPASLPCLRWEPYGVAPRSGSLEETLGMVTNLSRVYTANNEVVSAEVVLNSSQEPTFRTFYKTTLSMGTQWFNGDILRNGVYENYELCFIGAPPVFTPIAHNVVRASFTLLTRGEPLPPYVYELTATQAVNIAATGFGDAESQPAAPIGNVVSINTLATDRLEILKPSIASDPALTWNAMSVWPNDGSDPPGDGLTWFHRFDISDQDDDLIAHIVTARAATSLLALPIMQALTPIIYTGRTQYQFWGWDTPIGDNRGGVSLRVNVYSRVT